MSKYADGSVLHRQRAEREAMREAERTMQMHKQPPCPATDEEAEKAIDAIIARLGAAVPQTMNEMTDLLTRLRTPAA